MKLKKSLFAAGIIVIIIAAAVLLSSRLGISCGLCIETENGAYMIVMDNSPIVMSNRTSNEKMFDKIDTGDKIFIVHDGIAESYPGQTGAYFCMRVSKGTAEDIPQRTAEELHSLGWIFK